LRTFANNLTTQPEEPIPEMNIAVIGGDGVGKSTFVQRALDLPSPAATKAADRKIPYDGTLYRIRLLEIPIDDVEIDDDDTVSWPDSVADRMMPHIDGVLTLYDVADRQSMKDVPETLGKSIAIFAYDT
jgi:GTPase SAR1 family protein